MYGIVYQITLLNQLIRHDKSV